MKVSIIIPNFNGKRLLKENLPKVLKACQYYSKKDWEIIVVDDASTDESALFVKKRYPKIRLVVHQKNQQFAISCNDGVKVARGRIVVLLNNDVVPEKDFLKPILESFTDGKVFSVGCKEKSFENGRVVFSGRAQGEFRKGFLIHWRAGNQNKKDTLWTTSGSAAYRKSLWLKLGGLDPLFRPAYGEDIDLSYRALKADYKILFEPKSCVFHQHETTNLRVFGKSKIKIYGFKNQFLFVWKNITDFSLFLAHLLWLPYHLIFSGIRSRGLFLLGFLQALAQLPEALGARQRAKKQFVLSDKKILERYGDR